MLFALSYWLFRRMIGWAGSSKARTNDVEVLVFAISSPCSGVRCPDLASAAGTGC